MTSPEPESEQDVTALETAAQLLETSADYRVLRRLKIRQRFVAEIDPAWKLAHAVVLDTETTGTDVQNDQIIELTALRFRYVVETGQIVDVEDVYTALEDPGRPIPAAASAIHGIDDQMVKGRRIDDQRVAALVDGASWIVAHNAAFDRALSERRWPLLEQHRWACSYAELPWQEEGFAGSKLEYLAHESGFFFDAHRSEMDCRALLELLRRPLPKSRRVAWQALLERASQPSYRLWALDSPFETKDQLRARGYRWDPGRRCWNLSLSAEAMRGELQWLRREVYGDRSREVEIEKLDGKTRYSQRFGSVKRVQVPLQAATTGTADT